MPLTAAAAQLMPQAEEAVGGAGQTTESEGAMEQRLQREFLGVGELPLRDR